MTRRPAVTLVEVLITMFIMAIGMLALMVLFPLGAISMGQALKDDRCMHTASMAEQVSIALDLRHDTNVELAFAGTVGNPVYVDPYGVLQGLPALGLFPGYPSAGIPRISPSFITSNPLALQAIDRWFSLPDDITFAADGAADTSFGYVERERRYSYAYLLQRLPPSYSDKMVNLTVVVYSGRPVMAMTSELSYTTYAFPPGTNNGLLLTWNPLQQQEPNVKRGGWILDTTNVAGRVQGVFYRVTNIVDTSLGTMVVEVAPNLRADLALTTAATPGLITVMDNVAEVFDKGTSWQP